MSGPAADLSETRKKGTLHKQSVFGKHDRFGIEKNYGFCFC